MNTLQTYGATVFKFDRSGKKWQELGSGVVSFTLKEDRLVISVNALTFFVQGGVRQKGPKAVVMRVRDDSSTKGKSENIILAVRFERERDARNLFHLLASTQWIRPRSRGRKPQRRRPPPAFFMSMGTREQENIRALVSNAELRYIEDHTIQRQLKAIYKMTPSQIEEAINFFQPWLRHKNTGAYKKANHNRAPSLSLGTRTDSSLPSIRTKGRLPTKYTTPAGSTRPAESLRAHAPSNIERLGGLVTRPPLEVEGEGKQDKPEDTGEQLHLESNEAKERPSPLIPKSSTPRQEEMPLDKNLVPPEGNRRRGIPKESKRADDETERQTSSLKLNEATLSTPPTSEPGRSSSANRVVSPLTTQNLMLHNKMVPQLKRDTHEKVTLWLKEFEKE